MTVQETLNDPRAKNAPRAAIDPKTTTVARLVLEHPECGQVFQRHRIDFCCKGGIPIEEAARAKGLDVTALVAELSRTVAERTDGAGLDPAQLSTPALVAHIIAKHHEYLRRVLPFVRALAAKVGAVHGDHDPRLKVLDIAVGALADALVPHLDAEEQELFPLLMSRAPDAAAVGTQLASMVDEHLAVAAILERIRAESAGFTAPDWACTSYRTLLAELERIEGDIFTHVHLENHVLLPRFAAR